VPLPTNVRVAGFDFAVSIEAAEDFTDQLFGQVDYRKRSIRISNRADEIRQRETLLHEILHAVDEAVDGDLNEHQISVISRGLFAVLRDNPELGIFFSG
jgi:Zn-dependent peptidase ImmA (M78 family)